MLPTYINTAKLVVDNWKSIKKAGKYIPTLLSDIGFMLAKIGVIYGNPISAIAISAGGAAVK